MLQALLLRFNHKLHAIADAKWRIEAASWRRHCDEKEEEWLDSTDGQPVYGQIAAWLRRMAGVWPSRGSHPLYEFQEPLGGLPGCRVCRPAAWDNVVRAIEDGINDGD